MGPVIGSTYMDFRRIDPRTERLEHISSELEAVYPVPVNARLPAKLSKKLDALERALVPRPQKH